MNNKMDIENFNFELPENLIAQYPSEVRSHSRLLIHNYNNSNICSNENFYNLHNYINQDDLLVFNDTKVLKARLYGNKDSGGAIETLIERVTEHKQALVQIKANKSPKIGQVLHFNQYQAKVIERVLPFYKLEFSHDVLDILEECGHLPLPPYIQRSDNKEDEQRYQTIFAKNLGAVAAPTASLHFDDLLMQNIKNKGIRHDYLTLHVGAGTFSPVKVQNIAEHKMHTEPYALNTTLIESIAQTRVRGGRVIAVGTTALRALESAYNKDKQAEKTFGETSIFITPGYEFKIVDGLITNFHLPKSTLLMLVSAFIGLEQMHNVYAHAIKEQYRFFSYGDAMLCWRK
ncbi:MAG: S-adenosylmethionine--tRNA ribosyltransferase-isomerase [Pseudomonadota bacterium]